VGQVFPASYDVGWFHPCILNNYEFSSLCSKCLQHFSGFSQEKLVSLFDHIAKDLF
jgi:hypothetical protein